VAVKMSRSWCILPVVVSRAKQRKSDRACFCHGCEHIPRLKIVLNSRAGKCCATGGDGPLAKGAVRTRQGA
jgi:hypothetical protein